MSRRAKEKILIPRLPRAGFTYGPSKMTPLILIVAAGASLAGAVLWLLWNRRMRGERGSGDSTSGSTGQSAIETPPGETVPAVRVCGEASLGATQPPSKSRAPDGSKTPPFESPTASVLSEMPCIPTHSGRSAPESGVTEPRASQDSEPNISIQVGAGPDTAPPQTHSPDSPQEPGAVVGLGQSAQEVPEPPVREEPMPAPATHCPENESVQGGFESQRQAPSQPTTSDVTMTATPQSQPIAEPEQEKRATGVRDVVGHGQTQVPPVYTPLQPPSSEPPVQRPAHPARTTRDDRDVTLDLRLRLVFDHRHGVCLTLLPFRRDGMPPNVNVGGAAGSLTFTQLCDDCYEDVPVNDIGAALREGIVWLAINDDTGRVWRWVLGGRELYVLAPAVDWGMSGFVSVPRLLLGETHHVLLRSTLASDVRHALQQAGCEEPEVLDEQTPGVPSGWLFLRRVKPIHHVPARDERSILNALCPLADVEPHFVGGIRLEARTWLLGHPPRIHFTGDMLGQIVMIDGQRAEHCDDRGWTSPGWDGLGTHDLWFAQQRVSYGLRPCNEGWSEWDARRFGAGPPICGACVLPTGHEALYRVRVPARNLLLVGAVPGQVQLCHLRPDLRAETLAATVPFDPVWALPADAACEDKAISRVVLFHRAQPIRIPDPSRRDSAHFKAVAEWCRAIRCAGAKGLAASPDDPETTSLWRCFCHEAKHLWRAMR